MCFFTSITTISVPANSTALPVAEVKPNIMIGSAASTEERRCQNRCRRDGTIDSGDGKSFGERLGPTGHSERARKQLRHTGGVSHSQHKSLFAKPKVQDSLPGGVSHSQHKRSKVGNSRRPETTYTSPTNTPMPLRKTPALNRPFQPPPLSPSWPKP